MALGSSTLLSIATMMPVVNQQVSRWARVAAAAVAAAAAGALAVAAVALGFVASIWPRGGVSSLGEMSVVSPFLVLVLVPVGFAALGVGLALLWGLRRMPGAPHWWRQTSPGPRAA